MPTTVNGIGTHYYGKKNVQTRRGICEYCKREVELSNYDTRLWFVIIYIPIIPLGKKRILNQCPTCTRHHVLDAKKWEKAKSEGIQEAMAKFQASPNNPEAAVQLHAALISFGQMGEADQLAGIMRERFVNDAKVQMYLGSSLQYWGRKAEAAPFFERALKINPEMPEAKVAVAEHLITKGELDEARKLLKFLEAPDVKTGLGPLVLLAEGFQKANRHGEALELFKLLQARVPSLAQDKGFRKMVKRSEAAAGAKDSLLAPRQFNWKPLIGFGAVTLLVLAGVFGSNLYIENHRTVHIVSGFNQPAKVEIRNGPSVSVSKRSVQSVVVAEGAHHATISGPVREEMDFTIRSSFFDRWFKSPVYALNVGGSALLLHETAAYVANPTADSAMLDQYELRYGKTFETWGNVDCPFTPLPKKVSTKDTSHPIYKTRVGIAETSALEAVYWLISRKDNGGALNLAEWQLRLRPEETELLPVYSGLAKMLNQSKRAEAFLAEGAKRRPIQIEWHRHYQTLRDTPENHAALVAEYEDLLAKEPRNSVLLYLRGRLCSKGSESAVFFRQAIAEDASNAFAHYALAYTFSEATDWAGARAHLEKACQLDRQSTTFEASFLQARMALGEFQDLEKEFRAAIESKPLDVSAVTGLCDVLAAQGKNDEAQKVLAEYESRFMAAYPKGGANATAGVRQRVCYSIGDFDGMEKAARQRKARNNEYLLVAALIEQGKVAEAARLVPADNPAMKYPYHFLMLAEAWTQAGNTESAAACEKRALELLDQNDSASANVAAMLRQRVAPPIVDLLDLSLQPEEKAVLAVRLASRFPGQKQQFLRIAHKLNVNREFPFHFIERLAAGNQ